MTYYEPPMSELNAMSVERLSKEFDAKCRAADVSCVNCPCHSCRCCVEAERDLTREDLMEGMRLLDYAFGVTL